MTNNKSAALKITILVVIGLLLVLPAAWGQEPVPAPTPEEPAPAPAPAPQEPAPAPEPAPEQAVPPVPPPAAESSAPLVVAQKRTPRIVFQIGVDGGGLGMGGADGLAGVNASFVFPVLDWLWVGIRPSLHYVFQKDSTFDSSWTQANAIVQFDVLKDPIRLYALVAGGYAMVSNEDLYGGVCHGWNVAAAAGVAWHPDGGEAGLFAELGFVVARAGKDQTVLVYGADGKPIFDETTFRYQTESVHRDFGMTSLTLNIGMQYNLF
jgi:hypothetical protein